MIRPQSLTFKLVSATAIFWLGFVILAALSLHGLRTMSHDLELVHDTHMQASQTAAKLRQLIQDNRTEVLLTYQHAPDSPVADVHDHPTEMHLKRLAERRQDIDATWKRLQALTTQEADRRVTETVGQAMQVWLARCNATIEGLNRQDFTKDQLAAFLLAGRTEGKALFDALQALETHHLEAAAQLNKNADQTYQRAWAAVLALLALALAPATWLAKRGLRRLVGGLRYAQRVSSAIADGRMEPVPHDPRGDEVAALLADMARMRDNLATLIGRVREVSESVEVASSEVAAGNQDLSVRTERTAGSLQQTASTAVQLNETVRQNADNARQANQLAEAASQIATDAGEVVGQVVSTMRDIHDSSRKIADIISVIDGIAFQTNILALNAAVEAARAGEQGRGFAVVANEVRSLASRSANAAREIKNLINNSVDKVENGSALVDKAGQTMQEVVQAIRRVNDTVAEIRHASEEQSSGVSLLQQSLTEMDQSTQQNAALVEQSAAAAESLKQQAQQLVSAVSRFR
ncbi:MAG: methyl-accepting chemotaxis protein [Aquabacterium sp.]